MWKIILFTEIIYRKNMHAMLLALLPFFVLYSGFNIRSIPASYILFWTILIILQQVIIGWNKEKRDRLFASLPISRRFVGVHRIATIALISFLSFLLFFIMKSAIYPDSQAKLGSFLNLAGINLMIFSLYLIFRDAVIDYFRRLGFTADRVRTVTMLLLLGLNLLGIFAFLKASAGKRPPAVVVFVDKSIKWTLANNPFAGEYGYLKFFLLSLFLAWLSVLSYERRKRIVD